MHPAEVTLDISKTGGSRMNRNQKALQNFLLLLTEIWSYICVRLLQVYWSPLKKIRIAAVCWCLVSSVFLVWFSAPSVLRMAKSHEEPGFSDRFQAFMIKFPMILNDHLQRKTAELLVLFFWRGKILKPHVNSFIKSHLHNL